jgi:hypothetical protein
MHGGFGGGGFGHGGGGGHHSGGGHHGGDGAHHGGHAHGEPTAVHNLGGSNQSIVGHMTSLVTNGHGALGHIASWLTGQHHTLMHHSGNGQNHVGNNSWTSAAIQVEKSSVWQKITKIPGIQLMAVFFVVAGWLFFLGILRHGDGEHTVRSPMPTQQEWRQELVGDAQAPESAGETVSPAAADVGAGGFDGGSMFGAPRAGFADASQTPMPNQMSTGGYVPQAQQSMPPQAQQSVRMPAQVSQSMSPMQAIAQSAQSDEFLNAHAVTATPIQMQAQPQAQAQQLQQPARSYQNPGASVGRRSFSARNMSPQDVDANALASGRGFHHRVVAER